MLYLYKSDKINSDDSSSWCDIVVDKRPAVTKRSVLTCWCAT